MSRRKLQENDKNIAVALKNIAENEQDEVFEERDQAISERDSRYTQRAIKGCLREGSTLIELTMAVYFVSLN